MNRIIVKTIKIPPGEVILGEYDGKLCLLDWKYRKMRGRIDSRLASCFKASFDEGDCSLFEKTERQLEEYFNGNREVFDIPLITAGTDFQKEVWEALQTIPYGRTESYGELAARMGREKAVRAVAGANGANGISILIPCHRIIAADGSLGGYAGGIPAKKKLLELESQMFLKF
ncbi:methylated-DNA--[protein]-cysteine S-methyltransferase [Spirochaeta isovalerica]|uniref:Methylated-DNA--protein-cysteine methyltransferase n=1 Tax=Spirochaeta isovalerica TaxID=150 RepID=A0A841RED7_9SPIO|nr:methylated-DNA--[protein]-cysteine S-methyltransferase [Spirochaeta isovalerica]MBB6481741.1 methylated-DNA-[protein]-cysteine S-methyltransferase [Spirochaeta isovalerica]